MRLVYHRASGSEISASLLRYVEDNETPEMIMKKFEELERVMGERSKKKVVEEEQEEAPLVGSQPLDDDTLLEVFKQTSTFNVQTALEEPRVRYRLLEASSCLFCPVRFCSRGIFPRSLPSCRRACTRTVPRRTTASLSWQTTSPRTISRGRGERRKQRRRRNQSGGAGVGRVE